jgi:glycosyltransferase involved in cell wall biosynthesis
VPYVVSRRVAFPIKSTWLSRKKYASPRCFLSISPAVTRALLTAGVTPERIAFVADGVALPDSTSRRTGAIVALASGDPGKCAALLRAVPAPIEFTCDLPAAFRTARLFVYASEMEGLGSAALLAMAHGVPVVASNVEGLRETVADGVTGVLADNTPESFLRCIERLERDPAFASRLAAAARAAIEINYNSDLMVARTLACYTRVLG